MTTELLDTDCQGFNLSALPLRNGSHGPEFYGEACMVELANRAAYCIPVLREKFGAADFGDDHPSISPVIRAFCISFNDGLRTDEDRTRLLKPYVTRILGTKTTDADDKTRAWMATDWLVRVQAPAWLDLAGLTDRAAELWNLPALTSAEIAVGVQSVLDGASRDAYAAWAAARAAAGDAARDAARDAAWGAARAAAWDAARDAAWGAARAAAWDAAWGAARDAAWAAAWAAARDAARAAARDAARDAAWAAAWGAAWDAAWGAAWDAARDAQSRRLLHLLQTGEVVP